MTKICTIGLWHLGCTMSAHLASLGFNVVGVDTDATIVKNLNNGKAPLSEPGLNDLITKQMKDGHLSFTSSLKEGISEASFVWITFDTPVRDDDAADVGFVAKQFSRVAEENLSAEGIIVSYQVSVGFCSQLEKLAEKAGFGNIPICYVPENLRLGNALNVLRKMDRLVAGVREEGHKKIFAPVFEKICSNIIWMKTESAEMTKHALNGFLATSVVFANEVATVCESVGADARDVALGLLSDERIGPKAYLKPGAAFAGGTLARDVTFLRELSEKRRNLSANFFAAVTKSNQSHRDWAKRKLISEIKSFDKKVISVWGLSYKGGTDTLRRSWAAELVEWLIAKGARVKVFDPLIKQSPKSWQKKVEFARSKEEALVGSRALVFGNDDAFFKDLNVSNLARMTNRLIIDANGVARLRLLAADVPIKYFSVGFSATRILHGR